MREKARQFRSLLLEPLECRSVFSVDGLDVWQFTQVTIRFEFEPFQPAQYPRGEAASIGITQHDDSPRRNYENNGNKSGRSSHGLPIHRGRFNDLPLPPAESEGNFIEAPSAKLVQKPSLDVKPNSDAKPAHVPSQPPITQVLIVVDTVQPSSPLPQIRDLTGSDRGDNRSITIPNSISSGSGSFERAPRPQTPATLTSPVAAVNASVASNTAAQFNLASPNSTVSSAIAAHTSSIELSSPIANAAERVSTSGLADDFRFSRPLPAPSEAIVEKAITERTASLELLENLLLGLAENHRRVRSENGFDENGFDVNQPNSRSAVTERPETSMGLEIALADGGMIALALNRDIAMSELAEISEEARSENKAWIANVGIFRAFENGAVAATEYSGLTNRMPRNAGSNSAVRELADGETEVANSQFHPLLASTSAALGAMMLGLRRMRRKSVPWMFTTRKR
ncbi:MAG: hypothetical protein SFV81_05185 [Pirellulaceae bacterium]|nr:hypothetical protein [Pirellulaceae bacterium]